MRFVFLTLTVATLLSGCSILQQGTPNSKPADDSAKKNTPWHAGLSATLSELLPKLPKRTPPAPTASPADWSGIIRMVNTSERFVLIESLSATPMVPGEKYTAVGSNGETGILKMSALRNPPFTIADIVSGNPSPSDRIYLPRPTATPQVKPES